MKLETFKLLSKIRVNDKDYLLFSNNNCFRFPIRVLDNGSLVYPTIEEFTFFYSNFNFSRKDFYVYNDGKSSTELEPGKKVSFVPKVSTKKGLIAVSVALMMIGLVGYSIHTFTQPYDPSPITSSYTQTYQVSTQEETEDTEISDFDYCSAKGFKVELLPGGLIKINGDSDELIAGTVDEIDDKLGPEVDFNDVIESLKQNDSFKDEYKEILIEGIKNLEKNNLNMDLRILNYNLSRIKIKELSNKEIQEMTGINNILAFYQIKDGTVVISNDSDPEIAAKKRTAILHEILGHGMTETTIEDGSKRTSKLFIANVIGDGSQRTISPCIVGMSVSEGLADTITYYALDKNYEVTYDSEVFQLEFIRNLLGIDLSDVIDNGTTGLIKTMGEFGFKTPQTYIDVMDAETAAAGTDIQHYEGINVSQNIQNLIFEFIEIQSKRGIEPDEIRKQIENAFDQSSFDEVVVNSKLRIDECNVNELKEKILLDFDSKQNTENNSQVINDADDEIAH